MNECLLKLCQTSRNIILDTGNMWVVFLLNDNDCTEYIGTKIGTDEWSKNTTYHPLELQYLL
jgi:hypothetical protein